MRGVRDRIKVSGGIQDNNIRTSDMNFMPAFQNTLGQQNANQLLGFQGFSQGFHGHHPFAPPHLPRVIPPQMRFTSGNHRPQLQNYPPAAPVPSIAEWLLYCDTVPTRKDKTSAQFSSYSKKFDEVGINRLEQPDGTIVTICDVAGWLVINFRPASDILCYAQADLAAILAGQLQLPSTKK
jgi:hypothetical protein